MKRALTVSLLVACGLWAEPPAAPERRNLRVPFWLPETNREPLDKVQVAINAKPAKLVRLLTPKEELVLLVVLDWATDLTMVDPAREELLKQLETMPANVHVALLRAQDGLKVLADPGKPREEVANLVREAAVVGRAGLLDSIEPAQMLADSIAAKAKVRLAVLFLSDSTITNYREDYTNPVVNSSDSGDMSRRFPEGLVQEKIKQLMASVLSKETPLFLVQANSQQDRVSTAYLNGLLSLAQASGGAGELCRTTAEIPTAVARMLDSIQTLGAVEVEWQTGKSRQLQFEVAAEGRTVYHQPRRMLKGTRR